MLRHLAFIARLRHPAAAAVLLFLALAGCGDDPTKPPAGVMPDFALADVNENSATFGRMVSPRDYRGQISAWYFGAAT
jgi:hypothetical protein